MSTKLTANNAKLPVIREFDPDRDVPDVQRVWHEVGWVDTPEDPGVAIAFGVGRGLVGEVGESVECAVLTIDGSVRYQATNLPMCAVAAVTTSRVARRLGLAQQLTALQLAHAAEQGSAVAALGMFDQGFYDKLGFGTSAYDNEFQIDPSTLNVQVEYRSPSRLSVDDYEAMHQAMAQRLRGHGGCVLDPPLFLKADMTWSTNGFGLGYYGDPGAPTAELTHFLWFNALEEHGPYVVGFIAYRSIDQLMELLGVIKSLGDQVYSVRLMEPPQIQLQALLKQPFRTRNLTKQSTHQNLHRAMAWFQMRMLDVPACVAARQWQGAPVDFILDLSDPIEDHLAQSGGDSGGDSGGARWQGVQGHYRIHLGEASSATQISPSAEKDEPADSKSPRLYASVNAFTRLWFGVAAASGLVATDGLRAPDALLHALDTALLLPAPRTTWEF